MSIHELTPAHKKRPLTDREMAVLTHRANGLMNKQIASVLGLSTDTIKDYAQIVLRKMDAMNMTEAVYRATKQGII